MSLRGQIKWGIIGCGNVTDIKSGPAFNKIDSSRIVAVMRRDAEKAREYAVKHKVGNYYSDAELLINDPDVNAIYIATPPDSHAIYAILAMKAGKPVYVEKPMARTYQECLQMIECSKKTRIPLFVAYYRRALHYFLKVKELIESNILGEILHIDLKLFKSPGKLDFDKANLPWRLNPQISGGGYFIDLASHQLDILEYYFGEAKLLESSATNEAGLYEVEDTVNATFDYPNNISFKGMWSFVSPKFQVMDRTIIKGDKGTLAFSFFTGESIQLKVKDSVESFPIIAPKHIQQPMIAKVVDELLGKGKAPSDIESAARINKLMEEIIKPYYTIDKA